MEETTRTFRTYPSPETVFTKSLLADIAHLADTAARNRRLKQKGFEATDVYNEVVCDILDRIALGETLQDIVDGACKSRVPAFKDTTDKLAISYAIGKMCAASAMRLFRSVEREVPVGDAAAVVGEEVPSEQRDLSEDEKARGNDRQMTAVLARKATFRGIHRADVYGVADWSRGIMKDNATRMFAEADKLVMASLFDSDWSPVTEAQQDAWNQAFQGDSVADVLFGAIPNVPANAVLWTKVVMGAFGVTVPNLTHLAEADKQDMDPGLVRNTYPVRFPYKPLTLTVTRTSRAKSTTKVDKERCGHCRSNDASNPFILNAVIAHNAAEQAKKRLDDKYTPKPYIMPKLGKNCPPGRVLMWRGLDRARILPESASDATLEAFRRALVNFGQYVKKARNQYWMDEAANMVVRAQVRTMMEERDGVGHKVRNDHFPARVTHTHPFTPYCGIWPEEVAGGKEARRFSIPTYGTDGVKLDNLVTANLWDSMTIDLALPIPGFEATPFLPGAERQNNLLLDMRDGWIKVSNTGNADHEGITGTFVVGLPGLLEWTRAKNNARKVLKALIGMRATILLGLAN